MQFEKSGAVVSFFHVATNDNPADAGTRGLAAKEIGTHDWVQGPNWMKNDPSTWNLKSMDEIESTDSEIQNTETRSQNVKVSKSMTQLDPVFDLSRFSKLDIALRTVIRAAKFVRNTIDQLRKNKGIDINIRVISQFELSHEISAQDISAAEKLLISQLHRNLDLEEIQKRFRDKQLIRDKEGIIRHLSRLQYAQIPVDAKSPIFLPSKCELTRLVLTNIHAKHFHCGKDHTLAIAQALSPVRPTAKLRYRAGPGHYFFDTGQAPFIGLNDAGVPVRPTTQLEYRAGLGHTRMIMRGGKYENSKVHFIPSALGNQRHQFFLE
ncbi:hypothetical protein Aduo_004664 [Ancylostoma duodenale]